MSIISHITLGTNDKARSATFYDAVLGAIGFARLPKPPEKPLAYERDGQMPTIYIYTPEDGRPATWGNGTHIAFIADSKAQVHAFHDHALRCGRNQRRCAGSPPALWPELLCRLCPRSDGNKLQAVYYGLD